MAARVIERIVRNLTHTNPHTYAYYGDHRSGSTWIVNILFAICQPIEISVILYGKGVSKDQDIFIADVNADALHLSTIQHFRAFHVIRDPRDVVVSAYFSHKYSHPDDEWLRDQRELLKNASLDEGIRLSIDFRSKQFNRLAEWNYSNPTILEIKFENLIKDPVKEFTGIFHFLGLFPLRVKPESLDSVLACHTFQKLSGGRQPGAEDIFNHYRRGTPGDWRKYFSPQNKAYFKDQYGHLLIKLGYESNYDW